MFPAPKPHSGIVERKKERVFTPTLFIYHTISQNRFAFAINDVQPSIRRGAVSSVLLNQDRPIKIEDSESIGIILHVSEYRPTWPKTIPWNTELGK